MQMHSSSFVEFFSFELWISLELWILKFDIACRWGLAIVLIKIVTRPLVIF